MTEEQNARDQNRAEADGQPVLVGNQDEVAADDEQSASHDNLCEFASSNCVFI